MKEILEVSDLPKSEKNPEEIIQEKEEGLRKIVEEMKVKLAAHIETLAYGTKEESEKARYEFANLRFEFNKIIAVRESLLELKKEN